MIYLRRTIALLIVLGLAADSLFGNFDLGLRRGPYSISESSVLVPLNFSIAGQALAQPGISPLLPEPRDAKIAAGLAYRQYGVADGIKIIYYPGLLGSSLEQQH